MSIGPVLIPCVNALACRCVSRWNVLVVAGVFLALCVLAEVWVSFYGNACALFKNQSSLSSSCLLNTNCSCLVPQFYYSFSAVSFLSKTNMPYVETISICLSVT
jgi:hypothetical protein